MSAAPPPKKTSALVAFEKNLEHVNDLIMLARRERRAVTDALQHLNLELSNARDREALARLSASLKKHQDDFEVLLTRRETVALWGTVILVTCLEAYLQDVLSAAAEVDPDLMGKPEQAAASYADVMAAPSLKELTKELRSRWARSWLSNSGPTKWIARLQSMGARGYPVDLAARMERIWGIRHLVVHSAGIATADFVRLHPGVVTGVGDRVRVDDQFKSFLIAANEFLKATEGFFVARFPSLLADAAET